ncbi:MAG: DUF6084 family protein [bacterium]
MTDLEFAVADLIADRYAAAPSLTVRLRITETTGAVVHAVALRCQIRIEPQRRPYDDATAERLADLFGGRERWRDTLRPFLWTHAAMMVPGFTTDIEVDLPVACTYDFDVAAAKYLHAVRDGDVPLVLLFSGTVFTRGATGFSVEQIPWHKDVEVRLPAAVWRAVMDVHFPNSAWIRIPRDTLDALAAYKGRHGLLGWEDTLDSLLAAEAAAAAAAATPGAHR